jgi:hypothetical protein
VINLVNCHGMGGVPEGTVYIGRAGREGKPARSPLSNPFGLDAHGPVMALRLYRVRIAEALATPSAEQSGPIIRELARVQAIPCDVTLACWCASRPARVEGLGLPEIGPESSPCHGDLVASVVVNLGVRLETFARPRFGGDGLERWAAWVARDCGKAAAMSIAALVFGVCEARDCAPHGAAGLWVS